MPAVTNNYHINKFLIYHFSMFFSGDAHYYWHIFGDLIIYVFCPGQCELRGGFMIVLATCFMMFKSNVSFRCKLNNRTPLLYFKSEKSLLKNFRWRLTGLFFSLSISFLSYLFRINKMSPLS